MYIRGLKGSALLSQEDLQQEWELENWQRGSRAANWRVSNMRKAEYSKNLLRYCPVCGTTMGWRVRECRICGNKETEIYWRFVSVEGSNHFNEFEERWLEKIEREEVIGRMIGTQKMLAWELLQNREIFTKDHVKYLAEKYGISERAVRYHRKRIAEQITVRD